VLALATIRWAADHHQRDPLARSGHPALGRGQHLVGCLCGLFNGVVCKRWKIQSSIVTLGMLNIARGAALQISNSRTIFSSPDSFNEVGVLPLWMGAVTLAVIGIQEWRPAPGSLRS